MSVKIVAPGKLILLGEYAVLHGGRALVAAVDRAATCTVEPADRAVLDSPGRYVEELLRRHPVPGRYRLDSAALGCDVAGEWTKLGLGSSAATTVAMTRALLGDVPSQQVFAEALDVHREVQGSGSGADIAASAFGGLLSYRAEPFAMEPLRPFGRLLTVWTGRTASTPRLVAAIDRLREREPGRHADLMDRIAEAAQAGIDAVRVEDRQTLCRAAADTARALMVLEGAAGVSLVPATIHDLRALAGDFSAVVKPTGAGGGDLAWCVAPDPEDERRLGETLEREGWRVFWLEVDPLGVRVA